MIYPKKISSKKVDTFINIFRICILLISILLLIINKLTTPRIYWSHLCILGFIYIYLTVRYSIASTRNIAGYVTIQTILLALLIYFIDYRLGYRGWSINIAFPILIMVSNVTMLILTIINYKDYGKYAINQLMIVILSLSVVFFIYKGYVKGNALINIAIIISITNFLLSLLLCYRDFKEEIIRKFNI